MYITEMNQQLFLYNDDDVQGSNRSNVDEATTVIPGELVCNVVEPRTMAYIIHYSSHFGESVQ